MVRVLQYHFIELYNRQINIYMELNLQQRYDELKAVCKKQEAQIAKLQNQIRQRCQSFMLYSSRFKKGEATSEMSDLMEGSVKSISQINKVNEKTYSSSSSQKERRYAAEQPKPTRCLKLALSKQLDVFVEPTKEDKTQEINETAIMIESFKSRIAALQNNKNQTVIELQKANSEVKNLKMRVVTLQKNVEMLGKSQKKMKDKLKKLPQYEQRIDGIYLKLMREVKKEEFDEATEIQKHLNEKIEEIIDWIQQSKQNVDNILNDFNQIEASECEPIVEKVQPIDSVEALPPQQQPIRTQQTQANKELEAANLFSPTKSQQKIPGEAWTIISKLNQVDIKPFDASEVKAYNMGNQVSNRKEEEETMIKLLEENSMIFEEELKQSKNQIGELKEQLTLNRNKNHQLNEQLKDSLAASNRLKQQLSKQVNSLLQELQTSRRNNQTLQQCLKGKNALFNQLKQQLNTEKNAKSNLKVQLQQSRCKLSELQQEKMSKQVQALKDSQQISKLNATRPDLTNSKMTITETLEAPYFVQEELQTNANDEYVKRSFIRKKIVKRNLSATAYRIVSKSKEEVEQIVSNKLNQFRNSSKEKAAKLKAEKEKLKQQSLQNRVNRISQVSQPRDSDINRQQVRIIEVTTTTPHEEIRSAKIYSKGGQSNVSTRRKY